MALSHSSALLIKDYRSHPLPLLPTQKYRAWSLLYLMIAVGCCQPGLSYCYSSPFMRALCQSPRLNYHNNCHKFTLWQQSHKPLGVKAWPTSQMVTQLLSTVGSTSRVCLVQFLEFTTCQCDQWYWNLPCINENSNDWLWLFQQF